MTKTLLLAASAAAILASCSTAPAQQARSAEAEQELADALAGRVAGPAQRCIDTLRLTRVHPIDDWTILFEDGRTIYVQNPRGGCPGIANHRNVLVSRPMPSNQLCSGDIQNLFDPVSKIGGGACVFSDFVPYTKGS